MSPVGLFTHPGCLAHDPGPGHPESPARLRAVMAALDHPDFATLMREAAPMASEAQLELAHPAAYVRDILRLSALEAPVALDADTVAGPGSVVAARLAAGGVCAAVDAVMSGRLARSFVAVRPPGHHAEPSRAMGFCMFGSAAIGALHARARWGVQRVAVVDFDVHHGNGTQAMFAADPDLFYASSHQMPCYPGTGAAHERGVAGNVVNMPLAPGSGGVAFRRAWDRVGLPALAAFAPELIIVSAGFDAHAADPLARLTLATEDFGWITDRLVEVAQTCCQGRLVSVLEGGYDLDALAQSAALHVRRLMAG